MKSKILKLIILTFLGLFVFNFSYAKGEKVLVEFNQNKLDFSELSKKSTQKKLEKFADEYKLKYLSRESKILNREQYALFQIQKGELDDVLENLEENEKVINAQLNNKFEPAARVSRDKYIERQWWIYNDGHLGSAGADIGAAGVWPQETNSWGEIPIGIIDSGMNRKHKDTKKNTNRGYDFIRRTSKKMRDDDGHGSFISGIIIAKVSNKKGIAGLSRRNRLKVVPLRFDFTTSQAIEALVYAKNNGIRIVNASWGTSAYDSALYDAIRDFPGLVIAAAGNDALNHDCAGNQFYPCDFDLENIICVGASNEYDYLAAYSDWGSTVDLLAPGGDHSPIISIRRSGNRYTVGFGSSCSAAFVSGAAGLVLSANQELSNAQIKETLLDATRKKSYLTSIVDSGGVLDLHAAVERRTQ